MAADTRSLPPLPKGYRLLHLETTDSTNAEARRRADAGERGPLWIWSLRQSAGRGRQGRDWHSHRGNLFASLLLTLSCPLATASQLALVSGIATFDAVARLIAQHGADPALAEGLMLKWPNDLLLERKKLAGILIESAGTPSDTGSTVVIGTGINLSHHPDGLPQPAIDLAALGVTVGPGEALEGLAACTELWIRRWAEGAGFQAIRKAWLERAGEVGTPITVKLPNEQISGYFGGLDASGAMRMQTEEGAERRIAAGEVFFPTGS